MPFAPLRRSVRGSPEPHAHPPSPSPAAAANAKQPPLLVLCARQPFVARTPEQQTVRAGDFFHVLSPPTNPNWYTVFNPLTGARGLAPAHIFDILSRSAASPAPASPRDPGGAPPSAPAAAPASHDTPHQRSASAKLAPFPLPGRGQAVPLVPGHASGTQLDASAGPRAARSPPSQPAAAMPIAPVVPNTFLGSALYDFTPERPDELGVRAGARIRVYAHSTDEWLVAARLEPNGGETRPGLVPITYIALIDPRTGHILPHKPSDLLAVGAIPSVETWKQQRAAAGIGSPPPQQAQAAPIPSQKTSAAGGPWQRSASAIDHGARSSSGPIAAAGKLSSVNGGSNTPGDRGSRSHGKTISLSSLTHGRVHKSSSSKNGNAAASISSPMSNPNLRDGPGSVMRLAASSPSPAGSHWPSRSLSEGLPMLPPVPVPSGLPPQTMPMPSFALKSNLGDEPVETVDGPPVPGQTVATTPQGNSTPYAPSNPLGPAPNTSEFDVQPLPPGMPTWAEVDAVHKEQGDYWYRIRCLWAPEPKGKSRQSPPPGSSSDHADRSFRPPLELELYRLYEDFYDFHMAFMTRFPLEAGHGPQGTVAAIIPPLPRPLPAGEALSDATAEQRRRALDQYTRALVALPRHLTRSDTVQLFFDPRPGDRTVPHGVAPEPKSDPMSSPAAAPVVPSHPPAPSWDPNDLATGLDQVHLPPDTIVRTESATSQTESHRSGSRSGGSGRTNGTASPPSSLARMPVAPAGATPATPSSGASRKQGWTKIKIFHSATDELVAVRIDPATITYAELLAKARERLGSHIGVLRYPESLGAHELAAAAGVAPDSSSGGRMVMARIVDDDDLHDWLDHGGGKAMLFAAAQ